MATRLQQQELRDLLDFVLRNRTNARSCDYCRVNGKPLYQEARGELRQQLENLGWGWLDLLRLRRELGEERRLWMECNGTADPGWIAWQNGETLGR